MVVCGAYGIEVTEHLCASEGVDRLLRVADEHQRRVPVEREAKDLPLHRIRVLELVDEHHPKTATDPSAGRRPVCGVGQCVAQQHLKVVIVTHIGEAFTPFHLFAYLRGELHPQVLVRPGFGVRPQPRLPPEHRRPREGMGVTKTERHRVGTTEAPQVQVVGDFGDEIAYVLHQSDVVLEVAGKTEPVQHAAAECVCGRDGRRIEVGQRSGQPFATNTHLLDAAAGEHRHEGVIGLRRTLRIGKCPCEIGQSQPGSFSKFSCGESAEGDQE